MRTFDENDGLYEWWWFGTRCDSAERDDQAHRSSTQTSIMLELTCATDKHEGVAG